MDVAGRDLEASRSIDVTPPSLLGAVDEALGVVRDQVVPAGKDDLPGAVDEDAPRADVRHDTGQVTLEGVAAVIRRREHHVAIQVDVMLDFSLLDQRQAVGEWLTRIVSRRDHEFVRLVDVAPFSLEQHACPALAERHRGLVPRRDRDGAILVDEAVPVVLDDRVKVHAGPLGVPGSDDWSRTARRLRSLVDSRGAQRMTAMTMIDSRRVTRMEDVTRPPYVMTESESRIAAGVWWLTRRTRPVRTHPPRRS